MLLLGIRQTLEAIEELHIRSGGKLINIQTYYEGESFIVFVASYVKLGNLTNLLTFLSLFSSFFTPNCLDVSLLTIRFHKFCVKYILRSLLDSR